MHLPGLIEIPLRLLLMITGLIAPGSMVLRALRLPWSLASAFLISSATLYIAVLLFACTGVTISLATLAVALGVVTLTGGIIPQRISPQPHASSFACFSKMGAWLPLYLAFWAIVIYRLAFQPLTGPDVYFRWSYLAEQILKFGSLDFYPPRSGQDFVRYFWAESIPPGIASLYTWAYGCGGSKQALWTSPVVALQLLSLHEMIWRLANRWGGEIVAQRAVLMAAACPLLTWSVLIGQETGMTALSIAGIVWCLQSARERSSRPWIVVAGVCAIVTASTREYGPIFAFAAIVSALVMRLPAKQILLLTVVSLPPVLAWPVRVWWLTGNPFYSLNVGGFFPTNAVFSEWSKIFHQPIAQTFSTWEDWQALIRYLVLWALPATLGLGMMLFLLFRRMREVRLVVAFIILISALWVVSVSHTGGGLFYSLRVLSPAFALLVVAGSYGMGLFSHHRLAHKVIGFGLIALSIEALPKTLALPENPYRTPVGSWAKAGGQFSHSVRLEESPLVEKVKLLPISKRRAIVTDIAGLPRVLTPAGFETIPLWSPEVAWLFNPAIKPNELAKRWQNSGLAYLAIGKGSPTADFVRQHTPWNPQYFTVVTIVETDGLLIEQAVATPHTD